MCFIYERVNSGQQEAKTPHPTPSACYLHPRFPLYPVLGQKLGFRQKTLISVIILISTKFLLFGLRHRLPLMLYLILHPVVRYKFRVSLKP